MRNFTRNPRPILLCPGPVHVHKKVLKAVSKTNISHREPEFTAILKDMARLVKPVVGIAPDDNSYEIAFISGSGTAANETVLSSLGAVGRTLVISNGEFGERLFEVVRLHNPQADHLFFNWQKEIDVNKVETALASKQYRFVAMVHHETSTGVLNPVAEVARLAHRYGALISVDCISSIGAEVINAKEWGLDVVTGTSGKALSALPGVGILVVNQAAQDLLNAESRRVHYLDLHKHLTYMRDLGQTPNTPAVHSFVALHEALKLIHRTGIDRFRSEILQRAELTRSFLHKLRLEYDYYGPMTSRVLTCVTVPSFITFDELAAGLKQVGIVIYAGKGPLKARIFQIGHIGDLRRGDTLFAMRQLEKVLRRKQQSMTLQHPHIHGRTAHVNF